MSQPLVEIVIVHWRRPGNLKQLLPLARRQTVPIKLTLIDTHLEDQYALPSDLLDQCDLVFRWTYNFGGWNRYVPVGGLTCKYTLMIDDDVLFDEKIAEHFLEAAARMPDFGMLGLKGRLWPGGYYVNKDVERSPKAFIPVDCLIRAYFVPTYLLGYAIVDFEHYAHLPFIGHHDDIIACAAITRLTGKRSFLTPTTLRTETETQWEVMPQNDAQFQRPGAHQERVVVAELAAKLGYPCLQ